MHIKYIEIDWHIHTDNKPSLKVLVDKIPDNDDFIYEEHDVGNSYKFYIANYRGHIRHFLSTSDKRGYGGRTFKINVYIPKIDEVVPVHIKGPWDSGVEYIYATTGKAAQNISLTDDFEVFKRGYTFSSAYFDIKLLKNYIAFSHAFVNFVFFCSFSLSFTEKLFSNIRKCLGQ